MGIALFTLEGFFAPLQAAFDWLAGAARLRPAPEALPSHPAARPRCSRLTVPSRQAGVLRLSASPVRVLRVVDRDAPATAGRMVISGRMADVCAELDRLAAREALPVAGRSLPRRH